MLSYRRSVKISEKRNIMTKAIYPGSFDPITLGHLDIIKRASKVVDELIIGVLINKKKSPVFTMEERMAMIEEVVADLPNVSVQCFEGLTVEFARKNEANVMIRGLRAVTDFESEMQIAQTNHSLESEVDTIFFTTSLEYAFLSSTIVKEVAYYGGDISEFVPANVERRLREKFAKCR